MHIMTPRILQRTKNLYVSPGSTPEEAFVTAAQSTDTDTTYLLPQYATAFLLAKDVSLEFSGMSASVQASSLSEAASASVKASYGPYHASASFSYANQRSHMKAESTSDGLRITIPGAQIIGYYTDIIPKFPVDQDS